MTDALDNVALDGRGHLAITPQLRNGQWTSGRIETRRADFTIPPGGTLRVEARIALPAVNPRTGAGYWPAFWMLGSKLRDGYTGWPAVGEIDILEAVNGRPSVLAAMHCGVTPGGPCQEPQGLSSGEHPCPNCHGTFHTYAVEMTEARTTWFLDNKPYFSLNRSLPGAFFLILNVAIGGGFPTAFGGGPTDATLPGQPMLIDHVTVQTKPQP
ncbi:family 16 glycosylhydrolase [Nonomuraea sp. NPDC050556]|uniref:family 16 glycosylhydrolase n=1 Tax=Nonomuraea sp. NPDC050556 TaxID=3364369 RepID=UPI0037A03545